jgi:hypothetical protein
VTLPIQGDETPETLQEASDLAWERSDAGDWTGAVRLQQAVVAASVRVLGQDHVDTLAAMTDLSIFRGRRGDLAEAQALQEAVLAAKRRLCGDEHSHTFTAMNNLAQTLHLRGDLDGAWELQERAFHGLRTALGPGHPVTMNAAWVLLRICAAREGMKAAAARFQPDELRELLDIDPAALLPEQRQTQAELRAAMASAGD